MKHGLGGWGKPNKLIGKRFVMPVDGICTVIANDGHVCTVKYDHFNTLGTVLTKVVIAKEAI